MGQYLLYVRAASPDQSGQPPKSEPGRYDIQPSEVPDGWQAVAADRGILRDVGIFLLLALGACALERRRARRAALPTSERGEYGLHER